MNGSEGSVQQLITWSDLIYFIGFWSLIGGVAGLIANFGATRSRLIASVPFLIVAFAPGAVLLAVTRSIIEPTDAHERHDLILGVASLVPLLGCPVAGLTLRRRRPFFRSGPTLAIIAGPAILLSLFCFLTAKLFYKAAIREQQRQVREYSIKLSREAEVRLRHCALTLSAVVGASDARRNHVNGDHRLYKTVKVYQESIEYNIPGLDPSTTDHQEPFMVARSAGDDRAYLYGIKESPKGEIWTDRWFDRPVPPSATACERATQAYVAAYNSEMLKLGPLRKPLP